MNVRVREAARNYKLQFCKEYPIKKHVVQNAIHVDSDSNYF